MTTTVRNGVSVSGSTGAARPMSELSAHEPWSPSRRVVLSSSVVILLVLALCASWVTAAR